MNSFEIKERFKKVRKDVLAPDLDAVVITGLSNVRYLSGFTGSNAFLFLARRRSVFITDGRYETQAGQEVRHIPVKIESKPAAEVISALANKYGVKRLGFEATHMSAELYNTIRKSRGLSLKPVGAVIEKLRQIKSEAEIKAIRKAIKIAETAFLEIKPMIRPSASVTELDIAAALECAIKRGGSGKLPFDVIVASGKRSALPHASCTSRKLRKGDLVVVDWGAEYNGYCSDMTRTFILGDATGEKRKLYDIVLKAQISAIKSVKDNVSLKYVDKSARDLIGSEGYRDFFGHGTGHGVGLDIHELPRVSTRGDDTAKEGMVFTIEPGIYVPELGGVRIEDMVLVTSKGSKVLTRLPKDLEIIH